MNIAVYPGSSSFSTGSTPFNLYDADATFRTDADKVTTWIARRLGWPIETIELQDIQFYSAFEEGVTEYSAQVNQFNIRNYMLNVQGATSSIDLTQKVISPSLGRLIDIAENYGTEAGSGGNVDWKTGHFTVYAGQQDYDLNALWTTPSESNNPIEIKRMFHEGPPAIVRYFDPFVGTGAGSMQMLETFEWGKYSPAASFLMMPIYADLLRIQAIELNDAIRKSAYTWELHNNTVRVFPIPTNNYTTWFQYIVKKDRNNPLKLYPSGSNNSFISDYSNVPYTNITYSSINSIGKAWIWQYALACCKEMLGLIRGKYQTVPIPGSELTLNGADLITQAKEEKVELITKLRENLEQLSPKQLMANQAEQDVSLQSTLKNMPLKIYIGGLVPLILISSIIF